MTSSLKKDAQPTSFGREQFEHAHTSVNRLHERLRSLALLSVVNLAADRVSQAVKDGVQVLKATACVVHRNPGREREDFCLVHTLEGIPSLPIKNLAAGLQAKVQATAELVSVTDLRERNSEHEWLDVLDVQNYLGVPIFDAHGMVIGVMSVFGGKSRVFTQEDEWWLTTARS